MEELVGPPDAVCAVEGRTVLGLFDGAGNLVAADDDGGAGLLSRIQYPIFETGYYYLAVTTFADFDFDGNGNSGGRYVVSLDTIEGLQLGLGDDDFEEVPLGFTFPFQGNDYTSVFVNSNGSLTFGGGDTDFSESVSEFLGGEPRIAPLWVDLSPNSGGVVSLYPGAGSFTVNFDGVPEWPAAGSNTFAVTLNADGSYAIAYGAVSATDGLVGTTEGFGVLDPGASDLSGGGPYSKAGTTYELFDGGNPFDLTGATLIFN